MNLDWKYILPVAVVGGAGLGAFFYLKHKMRSSVNVGSSYAGKSWKQSDPINMYLQSHNIDDKVLGELRAMSINHPMGKMTTSVEACKLLTFYTRALEAKKVLDIGVFTGCSAFSMALGLPDDGRVIACDVSKEFTSLGQPFWDRGGVSSKIDLRLKPAAETLQEFLDNGEAGTFDLVFIDADKSNYSLYYECGVKLLRKNGLIVVDNVLWKGQVADLTDNSEETAAIRAVNNRMRDDPRVDYVLLNISDGVSIAQKL